MRKMFYIHYKMLYSPKKLIDSKKSFQLHEKKCSDIKLRSSRFTIKGLTLT